MNELDARTRAWSEKGYRVVSQSPTTVQLVRPRRFNFAEFVAMPIYVLEYLTQRDRQVLLQLQPDGTVLETGSGTQRSRYQRAQERPAMERLSIGIGAVAVIFVVLWAVGQVIR